MSTELPKSRGSITTEHRHDIMVRREYDLPRDETVLTVSCNLPDRFLVRRVTYYPDDFNPSEELRLVDLLASMLKGEA